MNRNHCHSLSCGHHGPWLPCGHHNHGCSTCSCGSVASDGTPACNPWAPWGLSAGHDCWPGQRPGQCGGCGCTACQNCSACGCGTGCRPSCDTCVDNACTCDGTNGGCLVPRIISTGRTFQRRITQTLCIDDLPDYAESPLTLVCVTVSGPATWEQISECRQSLLRVTVPVAVQVRDCAGRCLTGHSTVTLTIPLCMNCPAQDFWRGQLYVAPCIRLAAPVTEDDNGCFEAALEVQAEVYLLRMQVIDC